MATLRIATHPGSTKVFLTATGGTGTPNASGYSLTQVVGLLHDAEDVDGLVGGFYGQAKNAGGEVQAEIIGIQMIDDDVLIDTTVEDETKINAIVADAATAATQSTAAATDAATTVTQTEKASLRFAVGGRWTDEDGKTFDLTIEDTP